MSHRCPTIGKHNLTYCVCITGLHHIRYTLKGYNVRLQWSMLLRNYSFKIRSIVDEKFKINNTQFQYY